MADEVRTGEFSDEEQRILAPFMTNLDKPVFALRNLPEVVKGALFSRYSRTTKSLRRVLLDEFINKPESGFKDIVAYDTSRGSDEMVATRKAEEFYERVLVGYGDDSVAELAGCHIAVEDCSNISSKIVEDSRIGLSPLEKSTRYVWFDQKVNSEYRFYREPVLLASSYADDYLQINNLLFDAYAKLIPEMTKFVKEKFPKEADVTDRAYESSVRAKACDVLRNFLPASTLTNIGLFGNGRAFEYLLTKMYAHDLSEARNLASSMHDELNKVIPAFVKRANDKYGQEQQKFWRESREATKNLAAELTRADSIQPTNQTVTLVDYDPQAEEKIVAALLYSHTHLPLQQLREKAKKMGASERKRVIDAHLASRTNRRHRPGRAFENAYYTFDILGNYGMYRDLHRHRVLTQERQDLSTKHGYDTPKELEGAGLASKYNECMKAAKDAYERIASKHPKEAQYVVPMGYRIRWYITMNARESYHLSELRSMMQGHIDYRRVAQSIYTEIRRVHPSIAEHMKFVDMKEYALERLESEKKTDAKLEAMQKKYGSSS